MIDERFFHALHRVAPQVLIDLQTRADDPEAIAAWAAHWHLDSGVIRDGAARLRHTWTIDPTSAPPARPFDEDRTVRRLVTLDSPEGRWCEAMTRRVDGFANCPALPDPSEENLGEWLARARAMYDARARLCLRGGRERELRDHADRFYGWFVQVHVLGINPNQVAADDGVKRPAVETATRRVATELGLRRRTWQRGRPRTGPTK